MENNSRKKENTRKDSHAFYNTQSKNLQPQVFKSSFDRTLVIYIVFAEKIYYNNIK